MTMTDGLGLPTQYAYDELGNITDVVDGLGNRTRYFYASGASGAIRHKPILIEDAEGAITALRYDPYTGDLLERVEPHLPTENAADFTTSYQYDDAGRMTAETLPTGGITFHERDASGNETATRDDSGNVIFSRTYGAQ